MGYPILGLILMERKRQNGIRTYEVTLNLSLTYDLERPRLPGLQATSDGKPTAVGKEHTLKWWRTPRVLPARKSIYERDRMGPGRKYKL